MIENYLLHVYRKYAISLWIKKKIEKQLSLVFYTTFCHPQALTNISKLYIFLD